MLDDVLEELTKLLIKENFDKDKKYLKITKEELVRFCIKLIKLIMKIYECE